VEEVSLLQSNVQVHISNKLQDSSSSSHNRVNQPEEHDIHVIFNNIEEQKKAPEMIMEAIRNDGLTPSEWEEVGFDGHSHGFNDLNNTFPFVWDIKLRRRNSSLEEEAEGQESSIETEDEESFIEEEGVVQESSSESEGEDIKEPLAEEQADQSFIELQDTHSGTATRNKKQKAWVATAMTKLEKAVCDRSHLGYTPEWRHEAEPGINPMTAFTGTVTSPCYSWEYEEKTMIPGLLACTDYCESTHYSFGDECEYKCNQPGLEHVSHKCHSYCASNSTTCAHKHIRIAMAFLDVLSNFAPPGKAVGAIKMAVKVGTKVAMRNAIKLAAKAVAKKLLKKATKNLKKHMKKKSTELKRALSGRDVTDAELDLLLEEGVAMVVEARMAEGGGDVETAARNEAKELVEAIDPTGIADLIKAIHADSCSDMKIPAFPTDGFVGGDCGDELMSDTGDEYPGDDYRGCQTKTRTGRTCQNWNKQNPHTHRNTPASKVNYGVGDHNYCRNPAGKGIWCYTTDPSERWDYCDSMCPGSEAMTGTGADYRGCQTKTRGGRTCQNWNKQAPHTHHRTPSSYSSSGVSDHNYCRNPDGARNIWCYTTDPSERWEYCSPL
jgi:integrin beta 3